MKVGIKTDKYADKNIDIWYLKQHRLTSLLYNEAAIIRSKYMILGREKTSYEKILDVCVNLFVNKRSVFLYGRSSEFFVWFSCFSFSAFGGVYFKERKTPNSHCFTRVNFEVPLIIHRKTLFSIRKKKCILIRLKTDQDFHVPIGQVGPKIGPFTHHTKLLASKLAWTPGLSKTSLLVL